MVVTLCFSGYRMKSLPQGAASVWKHDVGNHWREKESHVNVRKGEGRRGKLPRAQLIGLYIGKTDVYFFPLLFFLSHAHKHAHLMIAGKHKHSLSCRTKYKEKADYEDAIAIPSAIAKGVLKAAGKINCFFASKLPYIKNVPLCEFLCEKKARRTEVGISSGKL